MGRSGGALPPRVKYFKFLSLELNRVGHEVHTGRSEHWRAAASQFATVLADKGELFPHLLCGNRNIGREGVVD